MKFVNALLSFLLLACFAYTGMAQYRGASLKSEAEQHYDQGDALINEMKFEEAADAFRKAIDLDSTFGLAYYRLAYALNWSGGENPMPLLKKAMDLIDGLSDAEQFLLRAQLALEEQGYEEGIVILQEMEKSYPANKEMIFILGDWSFHNEDHATAEKYLTKVLAMDPNFQRALQHLAWTYQLMENYPMMLAIAKRYAAVSDAPGSHFYLTDAYIKTDNVEMGLQELQQAQRQNPENDAIKGAIANLYMHKGQPEKAREVLNSIHDFDVLIMIGWGLFQQEKYEEAEAIFRRGLESKSDHLAMLSGLGWSLFNQKKYTEAEAILLKGYEIDSEHLAFINGLGHLKLRTREYDAAESYFRKFLEILPSNQWAEMRLGQIELIRKNYAAAEQHFRAAMATDSTNAATYVRMGYVFAEQNRFDEARTFAEKALAIKPNFGRNNLMGWVLIAGELDLDKGIEFAQKALETQPDNYINEVNIYPYLALPERTLGLAYLKKGKYPKAVELLESAAEQLPENKTIRDDLRQARKKLKGKK